MLQPDRKFDLSSLKYRYGFNGQEQSKEINVDGNHYTAQFWEYDPRIGRRWNIDPIVKTYESPYAAFGNNPIWNIDPDGADTAKYLSNSQLVDAIKIGYNVINNDVKSKTYNARKDVSKQLQNAVDEYWKNNQDEFNVDAYAEFRDAAFSYHKGLQEVATRSSTAWDRLGQRINNENINDKTNILQTNATIGAYNGSTMALVSYGANTALGVAMGGIGAKPGPGPKGPQIQSGQLLKQETKDLNTFFASNTTKVKLRNANAKVISQQTIRNSEFVAPPSSLTRNALLKYRKIAENAIKGKKGDPTDAQKIRIELIDEALKRF